jgi:hypothetical protein
MPRSRASTSLGVTGFVAVHSYNRNSNQLDCLDIIIHDTVLFDRVWNSTVACSLQLSIENSANHDSHSLWQPFSDNRHASRYHLMLICLDRE